MSDSKKPEWTPHDAGDAFASHVMPGVSAGHDGLDNHKKEQSAGKRPLRRQLSIEDYTNGVLAGDRVILARAITLIESNAPRHFEEAQEVLKQLLPHSGGSIRVGITGAPGAGKSTLIEALGVMLVEQGHKVAVLAVDPTSSITKGSILGDKTRMENLATLPDAFIRPSPTGGMLGGVARKTRESMLVCEAAGFDVILIETVGTGQSEISVRSMVDFFLLLLITGAGDELQGIKKGVMELADAVLINKADGDNKIRAQAARAEYNRALHYLTPATEGWHTRAYTASAVSGEGLAHIWEIIERFCRKTKNSGVFDARRRAQLMEWLHALVEEQLHAYFYNQPIVKEQLAGIEQQVAEGALPATSAARQLIQLLRLEEPS